MSQENPLAIADKVVRKQQEADARAEAVREESRDTATGISALSDNDALDLLLSAEPAEQVQTVELPPRKGTTQPLVLKLRSITEREWDDIRSQSEVRRANRQQRRGRGGDEVDIDNALMARLLVKRASVNVDWNNAALRQKFNAQTGEDVIKVLLLYGEVANLAQIVMEISGFDEDLIQFVGE